MTEPVRLLSSGSPDARELLRSARGDGPSHAQLDQLAAKLAPVVVAAPAAGTLVPWLFAGAALLGVAGILVVGLDRGSPASAPAPAIVTPAAREPQPPVEPPPPPPPPPVATVPATSPNKIATPRPAAPAIAHPVAPAPAIEPTAPPPAAPSPPREIDLLTPAHAALRANDPARALALAERHATLYASGVFAEEREAIAIEALHRLGHRERARTRLTEFAASYPRSSYRARLDRLVRE